MTLVPCVTLLSTFNMVSVSLASVLIPFTISAANIFEQHCRPARPISNLLDAFIRQTIIIGPFAMRDYLAIWL